MIRKITAKNFMSWENLEFDIKDGITLIAGHNHDDNTGEGSGKSAIFNALCWGLFGYTSKDTSIDDVVKVGNKSCSVFVTLSSGVTIERSRKPNDLAIWHEYATEPERGKDSKETQKIIERLLGFSYETFLQSCYFAQNGQIKFLTANEENKAKILSDLADLGQFDVGRKKAHEGARDLGIKLIMTKERLNDVNRSVQLLRGQVDAMFSIKGKLSLEREANLKSLMDELLGVSHQIQMLDSDTPELTPEYYMKKEELRRNAQKYKEVASEIKAKINMQAEREMRKKGIEKEIKDLKHEAANFQVSNGNGHCPTCGTKAANIEVGKRNSILQEYRTKIEEKIKEYSSIGLESTLELEQEFQFYNSSVYQIEGDLKQVELIESTQKAQKDKIVFLLDQQNKLKERYEKEKNKDSSDIEARIKVLQQAINDQQKEFEKLNQEINQITVKAQQLEILKEGFKEVKMWAFQDVLNELNSRANDYLVYLYDQNVHIDLSNTDSNELTKIKTKVTIDGNERPLSLFSGGQTRRLMLAIDLALSDIAQSRSFNPLNLLILDEYFKDLSEESMQKIFRLLESRKGSILLVEHNNTLKSLANNIFEIEYKNGTSSAKDP